MSSLVWNAIRQRFGTRATSRVHNRKRFKTAVGFETLESRTLLAIVASSPPLLPGNQAGVPISFMTDGLGPLNTLNVTLSQTIKAGVPWVMATIADGTTTVDYWNFNNAISFTGTTDSAGNVVNAVTLDTPYGVDLVGLSPSGPPVFKWDATCLFAGASPSLAPVKLSLQNVDLLTVQTPGGIPAATSTVVGEFDTPTLIPTTGTPGSVITFITNDEVKVLSPGVKAWDFTIQSLANATASPITLQGPINVQHDLTLTDTNTISITQPLTAGNKLYIESILGGTGLNVVISAPLNAGGDVAIKSAAALTVNNPINSTVGNVDLNAGTTLAVHDDIKSKTGIALVGNTGITTTVLADLFSATGGVSLTSLAGGISTAGTVESVTGIITITADSDILSEAVLLADTDAINITSVLGNITSKAAATASANGISMLAFLGITLAATAPITATSDVTLTATTANILSEAAIISSAGNVALTTWSALGGGLAISSNAAISASKTITILAGTNVTIGDTLAAPMMVTGLATGAGLIEVTAKAGNIIIGHTVSPLTVVDGEIKLAALAGTLRIESLVTSNLAIDLKAGQGIVLSNAIDLTAKVETTGALGALTITNTANQILIDAPVNSLADAITVTCQLDDIVVQKSMSALLDLSLSANTALTVGGILAPIVVDSTTKTIDMKSTTSAVTLTTALAFSAPGAASTITLTAGTAVTVPILLTAGGPITISSPDGFTVQKAMTSIGAGISITSSSGSVASLVAPLTAKGSIIIEGKTGVSVGDSLVSTTAGVNLTSSGGIVTIGPVAKIIANDLAAGVIQITSAGILSLGIDLLAGTDIVISTLGPFVPITTFTSTNGSISITSTTGDLNVSGTTLTALGGIAPTGGSIYLAAPGGALTVAMSKILPNPVFGNLTLLSGLTLIGLPPGALTVGGNVDITTGGAWLPAIGNNITSTSGSIKITAAASIDVTQISLVASLGSISLSSTSGSVSVTGGAALSVSPVSGDITLSAVGGAVTYTLPLFAGNDILVSSSSPFAIVDDLTALFGTLSITVTAGIVGGPGSSAFVATPVAALITAVNLIVIAGGPYPGPLNFTNPLNSVDTLTVSLAGGAGIDFTNAGTLSVLSADTATGPINITSLAGNLTVSGPLGAASVLTGITLTALGGSITTTAAGSLSVLGIGDVIITAGTDIAVSDSITAAAGKVVMTASAGVTGITVTGSVLAAGAGGSIVFTAPTGISIGGAVTSAASSIDLVSVSGPITVGTDISAFDYVNIEAGTGITLGVATTNSITSFTNNVIVSSVAGTITCSCDIIAPLGSIFLGGPSGGPTTAIVFSGGLLFAPAVGQAVWMIATSKIDIVTSPIVDTERLHIIGGGGTPIILTSPANAVKFLEVLTGGDFTFSQSLIPLSLDDGLPLVPSTQVKSTGGKVEISSLAGLRIVDGIEYLTTLSLTGPLAPTSKGVEFVVTSTGDVIAPPFDGTLRDMIEYANANIATIGLVSVPMSIVFDEPLSAVSVTGVVSIITTSLPAIVHPIVFDGSLPITGPLPGYVGLDGIGVPVLNANGLTFAAGSSGSIVKNAFIYSFTGTGVQVDSANNFFWNLTIGEDSLGTSLGNNIGIDITGSFADQNCIGVKTIGVGLGNKILNSIEDGIRIRAGADFTTVQGNQISSNLEHGIAIESSLGTLIGGTTKIASNTISLNGGSGSGSGIFIQDVTGSNLQYGARILGNTISNNTGYGVIIQGGARNVIGGTNLGSGNQIIGNAVDGVYLAASLTSVTSKNLVAGNTISGNQRDGVRIGNSIGSSSSPGGFSNRIAGNTISGNLKVGVHLIATTATKNQPANLVIDNTITLNGDSALNGGIVISGSAGQTIGSLGKGNAVNSNNGSGIVVLGNGTSLSPLNTLVDNDCNFNKFDGIRVQGAISNTIQANVVSGNTGTGISIVDAIATTAATSNKVISNLVSGNSVGIRVTGGKFQTIGGTLPALGNRVFSNLSDGISIESSASTGRATNTIIRNNRIGLDASNVAAGNGGFGINIVAANFTTIDYLNTISQNVSGGIKIIGGKETKIGSAVKGRGNIISINDGIGILVEQPTALNSLTEAVTIIGNEIENNTTGISVTGKRSDGVVIGRNPAISVPNGTGNTIRDNSVGGVLVDAAIHVSIFGNVLVRNGSSVVDDIRLINGGNASIVAPVLISVATRSSGMLAPQYDIRGSVSGVAGQQFFVDIYGNRSGVQFYLGRKLVRVGSSGITNFRVIVNGPARTTGMGGSGGVSQVVATATTAQTLYGSTSSFSNALIPT